MTMRLGETLTRTNKLAARLKGDSGLKGLASLNHQFKLKEYAQSLQDKKQVKPQSKPAPELDKIWLEYCESGNTELITLRVLRLLSGQQKMYDDGRFTALICSRESFPNSTLRSLLVGCLCSWSDQENHIKLRTFLYERFREYGGRDTVIVQWQSVLSSLLAEDAPRNFAHDAVGMRTGIREFFNRLSLDSYLGNFSKFVREQLIPQVLEQLRAVSEFDQRFWDYVFGRFIVGREVSKKQQCLLLSETILLLHKNRDKSAWHSPREQLMDYVLNSAEFGDPRSRKSLWGDVSPEAQKCFISWMSEKDLAFFFELIISHDPHKRKAFWSDYINSVEESRVVLGADDAENHSHVLKTLRGRKYSAASLNTTSTSAFILDFGKYIVVEFSRINNACYVYDKETFADMAGSLYKSEFKMNDLKNTQRGKCHYHTAGWELTLRNTLAELGIRPS